MKVSPSDFDAIKAEYMARKCRDFCTDYGIGVSSALFLFGNKHRTKVNKERKRRVKPEDPEIAEYKRALSEHMEGRQELFVIDGDEDPYYAGIKTKPKYYH